MNYNFDSDDDLSPGEKKEELKDSEKNQLTKQPIEAVKKPRRVGSAKDRDYAVKKDVMMAAEDDEEDLDFNFDEKEE